MARSNRTHREKQTEKEFDWTEEDLSQTQIFQWLADEESFLKTLTKMPGYTDDVNLDELDFTDFGDDDADCGNDDCEEDCAPKAHHHHHKHHHHHNNGEELVAAQDSGGGE